MHRGTEACICIWVSFVVYQQREQFFFLWQYDSWPDDEFWTHVSAMNSNFEKGVYSGAIIVYVLHQIIFHSKNTECFLFLEMCSQWYVYWIFILHFKKTLIEFPVCFFISRINKSVDVPKLQTPRRSVSAFECRISNDPLNLLQFNHKFLLGNQEVPLSPVDPCLLSTLCRRPLWWVGIPTLGGDHRCDFPRGLFLTEGELACNIPRQVRSVMSHGA